MNPVIAFGILSVSLLTSSFGHADEPTLVRVFPCHDESTLALAFSPDGQTLATGGRSVRGQEPLVRLWDVATARERAALQGHKGNIYGVAFAPNGKILATASRDQTVRLWSVDGKELGILAHPSQVRCVAFSPNGRLLATGCNMDAIIRLWDVSTRTLRKEFKGKAANVFNLCFSPDGRWLAATSKETLARLWNVEDGVEAKTYGGFTEGVYGVQFSPDGKSLAVNSQEQKLIRVFDVHDGRVHTSIPLKSNGRMAFSPAGDLLYADGFDDRAIHVFDVGTGKPRATYPAKQAGPILNLALSPDGRTLAWSGEHEKEGNVRVFRLPEQKTGAAK